jgi:glucan phosphorylase
MMHNSGVALSPEPDVTTPGQRDVDDFRAAVLGKLTYMVAKDPGHARDHDWLIATSLAARDRIIDRWSETTRRTYRDGRKRVYYFSLEFLIGRMLFDALSNLGLAATARAALAELGVDFDRLRVLEPDAALGNGGLGRLAACFMESMATLGIPAHGYGIRYDHGIFRQVLMDGWQNELPEEWLAFGNPWEFERPEVMYTIGFGGDVTTNGAARAVVAPRGDGQCSGIRHADPGLARCARQHAAAVVGTRRRPAVARRFQSRRPRRRARRARAARGDLARALPERRNPRGRGLAAAPGIFLRLGVAAGSAAPAPGAARRTEHACRLHGDPAQRYASGDRVPELMRLLSTCTACRGISRGAW